jgi:hypothetical protein
VAQIGWPSPDACSTEVTIQSKLDQTAIPAQLAELLGGMESPQFRIEMR